MSQPESDYQTIDFDEFLAIAKRGLTAKPANLTRDQHMAQLLRDAGIKLEDEDAFIKLCDERGRHWAKRQTETRQPTIYVIAAAFYEGVIIGLQARRAK